MKRITAVVLLTASLSAAYGQDAITKFFSKYENDQSFTNVNISSRMFGLFTQMEAETPEDKEVLEAISKLKGLKILAKENARDSRALYKEALNLMPRSYEELMSVRDQDKDMKFLIQEKNGIISEMVMVLGGSDEFVIMSLFGEIDLKQISRIGSRMNIKGLENLEKINGHKDNNGQTRQEDKQPNDNSRGRQN